MARQRVVQTVDLEAFRRRMQERIRNTLEREPTEEEREKWWMERNLGPIRQLGLTLEEIDFIHSVSVDNGEGTPLETLRRWLRTAISRYEVARLVEGEEVPA